MHSKHSLPTVRQDVHAQVQYESAHRQSTQQTQALAMSVLRKELCHHERPEAALVEVRLKPKKQNIFSNNNLSAMGWERSTSVKIAEENSQTEIPRSFTGDRSKMRKNKTKN